VNDLINFITPSLYITYNDEKYQIISPKAMAAKRLVQVAEVTKDELPEFIKLNPRYEFLISDDEPNEMQVRLQDIHTKNQYFPLRKDIIWLFSMIKQSFKDDAIIKLVSDFNSHEVILYCNDGILLVWDNNNPRYMEIHFSVDKTNKKYKVDRCNKEKVSILGAYSILSMIRERYPDILKDNSIMDVLFNYLYSSSKSTS
jgi:hypothetical protein